MSKAVVSRAWAWLGIADVSAEDGVAVVEMTPSEDMANSMGFVHGGMISALADSAMGRSLRTIKPDVVRSMSPGGRLVATASGTFAITREKGITEGSDAD